MSKTREILEARRTELETEVAAIEAKSGPLRERRERLRAEMAPMEEEMRRLNDEIKEIEQPALSNVKMELADVARGLGSKRMTVAPATKAVGE